MTAGTIAIARARAQKAARLVVEVRRHGAGLTEAAALPPSGWDKLAEAAGVGKPSATTKDVVLCLLAAAEEPGVDTTGRALPDHPAYSAAEPF